MRLLSSCPNTSVWLSYPVRLQLEEQPGDRGASVHVSSPGMKGRCFHSTQEAIGDGRGVGSELNDFEGGFLQLNPQTLVLYIQSPALHLSGCQPPRAPQGQIPDRFLCTNKLGCADGCKTPLTGRSAFLSFQRCLQGFRQTKRQPWQGNQCTQILLIPGHNSGLF